MNYVIHSGVKGQKWGVRRYQNEDGSYTPEGYYHRYGHHPKEYGGKKEHLYDKIIDDVDEDYIIKKGTKFHRATTEKNEKFKNRTYVSGYDGAEGMAEWLGYTRENGRNIYIDELETKRDVVMAGKKTVVDILKSIGTEDANRIALTYDDSYRIKKREEDAKAIEKTKKVNKKLNSKTFNFFFPNYKNVVYKQTISNPPKPKAEDFLYTDWNSETSKAFIKELKDRGYSGLSDPLDALADNAIDKDAVVFVNDVLKKVGQQKVG